MEELTGAQILVQTLIDQGVDTIFGYPGGTVLDIYDALYQAQDRICHIETTHEQHAAHAADGYARATGRTGVVLATSGPGATNLVTGIATAYLDSIPLVAITGNVANNNIGTDAFQEVDITGITLPITKHNYFVREVENLQDIVCEAFGLAMSGRPGPVLIDIPKDVQVAKCPYKQRNSASCARPTFYDSKALSAAAQAINESKKPFIYFGGGILTSNAGKRVVELAERISSPMGCSLMGISAVPTKHPLFLGMQGMHGHYASTMAMNNCDCLIALGVRFNDRVTGNREHFAPNHKIVRIDIDRSELSKTVYDQVDLVGDVNAILDDLLPMVRTNTHKSWQRQVREIRAQEKGYADYRETLTPKTVMDSINACRPAKAPVVTDVGQHQMWAAQYLSFTEPNTFITSGGLGTMGFGMGATIGAQFGTSGRAILITGDGSFGMNLGEMVTAVDHHLPITIVLLNNHALGMVRQWQSLFYGQRYSQTTLKHVMDYVALAEAFGAHAARVATPSELQSALEASFAYEGPTLIECPIDSDEFVVPMVPPGGTIDQLMVNMDDIRARLGE